MSDSEENGLFSSDLYEQVALLTQMISPQRLLVLPSSARPELSEQFTSFRQLNYGKQKSLFNSMTLPSQKSFLEHMVRAQFTEVEMDAFNGMYERNKTSSKFSYESQPGMM